MPIICVFLHTAQTLSARYDEFTARLQLQPVLPPHVTIKMKTELEGMSLQALRLHLGVLTVRYQLRPVTATLGAPAEFPIQGSDETVLHLPVRGSQLVSVIGSVLRFFDHELHLPPRGFEGRSPHVTLAERLQPAERELALATARSIEWPKEIRFDAIGIMHQEEGVWKQHEQYGTVPLLRKAPG